MDDLKTPIDILIEKGYDDVNIFSNPDYTTALIGLTDNYNAVYDLDLMVEWLMNNENMSEEEAADFILYNDSFYYGEHYPVIYYGIDEDIDPEDYRNIVFTKIEDLPDKNKKTN